MRLLIAAAVIATAPQAIDLESYCKGFCSSRYQDGIYRSGRCFCGDYYPVNLENRIQPLSKPRRPVFGEIPETKTAPGISSPEPFWEDHY